MGNSVKKSFKNWSKTKIKFETFDNIMKSPGLKFGILDYEEIISQSNPFNPLQQLIFIEETNFDDKIDGKQFDDLQRDIVCTSFIQIVADIILVNSDVNKHHLQKESVTKENMDQKTLNGLNSSLKNLFLDDYIQFNNMKYINNCLSIIKFAEDKDIIYGKLVNEWNLAFNQKLTVENVKNLDFFKFVSFLKDFITFENMTYGQDENIKTVFFNDSKVNQNTEGGDKYLFYNIQDMILRKITIISFNIFEAQYKSIKKYILNYKNQKESQFTRKSNTNNDSDRTLDSHTLKAKNSLRQKLQIYKILGDQLCDDLLVVNNIQTKFQQPMDLDYNANLVSFLRKVQGIQHYSSEVDKHRASVLSNFLATHPKFTAIHLLNTNIKFIKQFESDKQSILPTSDVGYEMDDFSKVSVLIACKEFMSSEGCFQWYNLGQNVGQSNTFNHQQVTDSEHLVVGLNFTDDERQQFELGEISHKLEEVSETHKVILLIKCTQDFTNMVKMNQNEMGELESTEFGRGSLWHTFSELMPRFEPSAKSKFNLQSMNIAKNCLKQLKLHDIKQSCLSTDPAKIMQQKQQMDKILFSNQDVKFIGVQENHWMDMYVSSF